MEKRRRSWMFVSKITFCLFHFPTTFVPRKHNGWLIYYSWSKPQKKTLGKLFEHITVRRYKQHLSWRTWTHDHGFKTLENHFVWPSMYCFSFLLLVWAIQRRRRSRDRKKSWLVDKSGTRPELTHHAQTNTTNKSNQPTGMLALKVYIRKVYNTLSCDYVPCRPITGLNCSRVETCWSEISWFLQCTYVCKVYVCMYM